MVKKKKHKRMHPQMRICIYMYIYIYIVIHRQTVSLYHNSSAWLDTKGASRWDRNSQNFTLDSVSYHTAILMAYVSSGIMTEIVLVFVCFTFCAIRYESGQFVRRTLHYASGSR